MEVKKETAIEECRCKRLEENKKRMEELNLNKLSQSLHPTKSPMKKIKPRAQRQPMDLSAIRRSSRVVDKPTPTYREVAVEPLGRPWSYSTKRNLSARVYANIADRQYAIARADDLQSGLDPEFPSFVKPMLQSHVSGGFWLGLPIDFCKPHLPKRDEIINLVDVEGNSWPTKYLDRKPGLSGGWRRFAEDHELVDGDAFRLSGCTKKKTVMSKGVATSRKRVAEFGLSPFNT